LRGSLRFLPNGRAKAKRYAKRTFSEDNSTHTKYNKQPINISFRMSVLEYNLQKEAGFNRAKEALLSNYNSQQTSVSRRFIGFVASLLAILVLSPKNLGIIQIDNIYKVLFLAIGILIMLTFTIFTAGRFAVFSYLSSAIIYVTSSPEIQKDLENGLALHHAIHNAVWRQVRQRKFFGIKIYCFVSEGKDNNRWKGWLFSFAISAALTAVLSVLFLL
jgi:hypothetical protein